MSSRRSETRLQTIGLFAGIGGLEEGLRRAGHSTVLLSEIDESARRVLRAQFPNCTIEGDVRAIRSLPPCELLVGGFPCQDLSQAGRTEGIAGAQSGLVEHLLDLVAGASSPPRWILLENVPFMLHLQRGRAIRVLVERMEAMGWRWAYRTVDALSFGLPQRRRRVFFLASPLEDPCDVLLADDAGPLPVPSSASRYACGFYWTEGNRGVGWAVDAIPPLKGGSTRSIPSPPAIWFPRRGDLRVPSLEDAERLQGFPAGWTLPADDGPKTRTHRWRLIGNAVSVPVAEWIGGRLCRPGRFRPVGAQRLVSATRWPYAAWGDGAKRFEAHVSAFPRRSDHQHLASFLNGGSQPLSRSAALGFLTRLEASGLRVPPRFIEDLREYVRGDA